MNPILELVALQSRTGHLRDEDLHALSARIGVPLYELQGLASFYPHFRREPPAPLEVRACRDLACRLRDRGAALRDLEARCADHPDARFEAVSCLGRCDGAPACAVNEVPCSADAARRCLETGDPQPETGAWQEGRRFEMDPHPGPDDHYGIADSWKDAAGDDARATALFDRLEAAGLRGMGGAGFPTGRKWRVVAAEPEPRVIICNADESEPGTFKDRVLLAEAPHLVVEGMVLAALSVRCEVGWVYIRHEYEPEREILERELERARERGVLGPDCLGSGQAFDIRVFVSPGGYVLGEETALLEALEGRRGEPRNKPPYPGVSGLHGRPTLINNVESFAQTPRAIATGAAPTKLFAVSGDVQQPAVVEAPLGTTLDELVAACGGLRDGRPLAAFLPGGASTGFLGPEHRSLPLEWDALRAAGSSLGAAAVVVVAEGADLLDVAANLTAFFRNESCGKCVPCRIGTEKALDILASAGGPDLEKLRELHAAMEATSICGLGQAALIPATTLLARRSPA